MMFEGLQKLLKADSNVWKCESSTFWCDNLVLRRRPKACGDSLAIDMSGAADAGDEAQGDCRQSGQGTGLFLCLGWATGPSKPHL